MAHRVEHQPLDAAFVALLRNGLDGAGEALRILVKNPARNALTQGANAIVGLRKTHAHYDQPGSQWRVSRVIYSGTAVVVT